MTARALGLLLGYAADRLLGDPRRLHPVAGFGMLSTSLEGRLYGDSRARGVIHVTLLVGGAVGLGVAGEHAMPRPAARTLATAAATWVVLGGCSLEREATAVHLLLDGGDLAGAREQVRRLVGRDTADLDVSEVARAAIESVAENTSDAVVAPLVWGAVAGIPGLLGYRAANTLDAMIGHHNKRYERYGWAAARLDDLVNLPGSRLTGLLTLALVPHRAPDVWRVWRRDAAAHPSPNAGVVEAAWAAALGVRLGGTNRYYGSRVEHRAVMGDGPPPAVAAIAAAVALGRRVGVGSALTAAVVAAAVSRRSGRVIPEGVSCSGS